MNVFWLISNFSRPVFMCNMISSLDLSLDVVLNNIAH